MVYGTLTVYSLLCLNSLVWHFFLSGDSWRISGDIRDDWDSIISRAEISAPLWRYAGPNRGWNDPDMLEVKGYD
ncbi:hypothetical protein EON65_28300 [archaeon]|nr:MAG: hypothetical protein EON65_28300 [archaeon]